MYKTCFFFSFFTLSGNTINAQSTSDWLFDDSTLPKVQILIHPDSLREILRPENRNSDHEFPATFVFNRESETDTVFNIGFRLRGNTSRDSQKKSFKVSFNTFEKGREYRGLDKMNLNGEHNDPSIIRSKLSWDIFRKIDLPAPRANHVKLYINDEYFGLYINVEHIDNEFVQDRFGTDAGNLYKCLYPADLSYISDNPNDYKWSPDWADRRTYDLKTNTEEDDYSDLASLIGFMENSSLSEFEKKIEGYLNVDGVLRWMAVDILTGNWDNYWFNQNNFYLYNNPVTHQFEFIPYDYDNTFGIDWSGIGWGDRDVNYWGENRLLTARILEVEEYRNRFNFYLNNIIQEVFNEKSLFAEIDRIKTMVQDAAMQDMYRTRDYGYGIGEYHASFTSALTGHVKYGLKPFISMRIESALRQIKLNNIHPIIRWVETDLQKTETGITLVIRARLIDEASISATAQVIHTDTEEITLNDTGEGADETVSDGIFTGEILLATDFGSISFSVHAKDAKDKTRRFPNNPDRMIELTQSSVFGELVINEFMADNETGIQDESEKFEDWVELYNPTGEPVALNNYFLTDDAVDPLKWALPDTTIPSQGFLLIWADNDDDEGTLHTNFGLSKDGEFIGLYLESQHQKQAVDTLSFGLQSDDVSFGRETDGGDIFKFFTNPTPGSSNTMSTSNEDEDENSSPNEIQLFQNYPNPFNPETIISFRLDKRSEVTLEIFTVEGRIVQTLVNSRYLPGNHSIRFDASSLSSGMYFYRLNTQNQSLTKKLILIK